MDDIVTFNCSRGYDLVGNSTVQCLESGNWSAEQPSCEEIFCPGLTDPMYGHIDYSVGTGVNITNGTTASVSCNNGYYYDKNGASDDILCEYG